MSGRSGSLRCLIRWGRQAYIDNAMIRRTFPVGRMRNTMRSTNHGARLFPTAPRIARPLAIPSDRPLAGRSDGGFPRSYRPADDARQHARAGGASPDKVLSQRCVRWATKHWRLLDIL
jgi:hypothetical protein